MAQEAGEEGGGDAGKVGEGGEGFGVALVGLMGSVGGVRCVGSEGGGGSGPGFYRRGEKGGRLREGSGFLPPALPHVLAFLLPLFLPYKDTPHRYMIGNGKVPYQPPPRDTSRPRAPPSSA